MPQEQQQIPTQTLEQAPEVATTVPAPAAPEVVLSPLLKAIKTPIPGDNPCGKDASYDEDFLAIKSEIDKLNSVSGRIDQEKAAELRQMMDATRGAIKKAEKTEKENELAQRNSVVVDSGGIDYALIKQKAVKVLSEKSKDIRVASYLCFALWQKEKFSGLSEGLSAIDILVGEFWDGLYPEKKRMGGRKSAIDFLTSKLGDNVEYASVVADDREPLESAKRVLDELKKHFTEKIPDSPPSLLGLSQAIEKCLKKIPKPAVVAPPSGSTSAQTAGEEQQAVSGSTPVAVAPSEIRTPQDALDAVKKAAKFMREQNRMSATSYRLMRMVRWDVLVGPPPNENGKTMVEAPAAQRRNALTTMRDAGNWGKLLDECELSFGQPPFHFWLDLQRLTVSALEGLGPEFSSARNAALTELALLLQRVPKLSSLTFKDGTPFADPATSDWIEETVMPVLNSSGSISSGVSTRFGDGELDNQFAAAKKILDGGDLAGAVALLQAGANNDNSRKSAFRRKLAIATLCMRGNQPAIAKPTLENLSEEIEKFSIDGWEPALALEVWTNLHKCYEFLASGSASNKQALQQLAEKVFEKICRLDMSYALASKGAKPKTKIIASASSPNSKPTNGAIEQELQESDKSG
jgi:type VI secretion system protein VasJ